MASPQKPASMPPWRTFDQEPAEKAAGFFGGALGVVAIALGVGALGVYALDYHRHRCDQCGSRWGHFGAFNLGDEESHTCSRCGGVQWWKCGAPHVLRGSQFVEPPSSVPAFTHASAPAFTYAPAPAFTYAPAPMPAAEYAPDFSYAPSPMHAYAPAPQHVAPSYAAPARTFMAGPVQQLPPRAPAYAPSPEYAPAAEYAPEYARPPEAVYARAPRYAPSAEYARLPARPQLPTRASRAPAYARAPEYAQVSEPSMGVAIRPKERWR